MPAGLLAVPRTAGRSMLAYITPAEAELLRRANVGGMNPQHRVYRGPGGVPRLDDGSDSGSDGGDSSGGAFGGEGGFSGDSGGFGSSLGGYGDVSDNSPADAVGAFGGLGVSPGGLGALGIGSPSAGGFSSPGFMDSVLGFLGLNSPASVGGKGVGLVAGLAGVPGLGPAATLGLQALSGQPVSGQQFGAGVLGTVGALAGGPLGGLVGSALGGVLGAHGNTDDPAGSALGGQAGTSGSVQDPAGAVPVGYIGSPGYDPTNIPNGVARYAHGGPVRGVLAGGKPHRGGLLSGDTPGRADSLHAVLPVGSYVIPADAVSQLGQGNTQAGAKMLDKRLPGDPQQSGSRYAQGGVVHARVSGGEYLVPPARVAAMGGGDPQRGAGLLNHIVASARRTNGVLGA